MSKVAFIYSDGFINMLIDGTSYNVSDKHPFNDKIVKHLCECDDKGIEPDGDYLKTMLDIKKGFEEFTEGSVHMDADGKMTVGGYEVKHKVCDTIIKMMEQGQPFRLFARFLEKLMANPSKHCVDSFWLWVEQAGLHIMSDGDIVGYKSVDCNYKDWYSGKFDNSPGQIHEIPRNQVDDDKHKLCSYGLHIGTLEYAKRFHGCSTRKMVLCKFSPTDVVSVPNEARDEKIRVCRYEVVSDHDGQVHLSEPCYEYNNGRLNPISHTNLLDNPINQYCETEEDDWEDEEYENIIECNRCGERFDSNDIADGICGDCDAEIEEEADEFEKDLRNQYTY